MRQEALSPAALAEEVRKSKGQGSKAFLKAAAIRHSRVIPEARSPLESVLLLRKLTSLPGHVFWAEEKSILDDRWVPVEKILSFRQITDAHLLSLVLSRKGCLATFDRGIHSLAPERKENAVCLIS